MKILLGFIILLSAFQSHAAEKESIDKSDNKDPVVFSVDGEEVKASFLRTFFLSRDYKPATNPQERKIQQTRIANELINIILMSKQAEAEKLDQSEEVQQQLEMSRKQILSKALISRYMSKMEVSDGERETAYQAILEEAENRAEYKTSNILLENEQDAETVIEKLKQGEKFSKLAEQHSIEKFSQKNSSDMGWISADNQEPEIATAIRNLAKGEFTKKPVKTRFGWHVILVEDKKIQEVPPLAKIHNKLTELVKQQKIREEIAKLRNKATIKSANQK